MKLILVRHSEVIEEYRGKYNGHIDIPLSKKGIVDAKELGKKLQNYNFDAIYCSDLTRAKETLEQFKLSIQPIYTEQLREKSWGKHEGMSFKEIEASGLKYTTFDKWIKQLDGESLEEFNLRIKDFFFNYLQHKQYETLLIVTHSGVIKTLLGLKYQEDLMTSFSHNIPYSSITKVVL